MSLLLPKDSEDAKTEVRLFPWLLDAKATRVPHLARHFNIDYGDLEIQRVSLQSVYQDSALALSKGKSNFIFFAQSHWLSEDLNLTLLFPN